MVSTGGVTIRQATGDGLRPEDFPIGSPESRAAVRALLAVRRNSVPHLQIIMNVARPRREGQPDTIQLEAKRAAIQALSNHPRTTDPELPNDTKHVTKQADDVTVLPQVIETNGRPVRARTADLHRVKVAL